MNNSIVCMRICRLTIVSALIALVSGCSFKQEYRGDGQPYDILIHGGIVIDGTGNPGMNADILVRGDSIAYIGKVDLDRIQVETVVDASERVVTPGFIDTHAHGNPISTPEFMNFTAMGVTTIVLGQDGSSPSDISEWMKQVEEARPALNIATMVGHGTVRNRSGVRLNPNPSPEELERMAELVEEDLLAGCFGLSTGLEYQPGSFSGMDELIAIARPVGKHNGIVQSHMRSEDDDLIHDAISELIAQGKGGGCAVQVTHLKVVYGHGKQRAEEILAQMDKARDEGIKVSADLYPYTASYTGIGIVFPDWAKPPNDYKKVVAERRTELADYLRKRITLRNGPEATLFGSKPWAGKTLKQVAAELNKPFEDVLIDDIGLGGGSAAYFVMDTELQDRLFLDPHVMVCTDGSPTMLHPRGYGSFAKVIRYYVREKKLLKLEEAVHKMSGLSAETMGLLEQKRGLLRAGFAADVLIFDPNAVQDRASYENPQQLAEGFDWVFVNGITVRASSEFTGKHGGKMLRHGN